jgi:anti-sigma factor RsiW
MNPHCDEMTGLIVQDADGLLTEADRVRLAAHTTTCAACAAAVAEQREARGTLAAMAAALSASAAGARVGARVMAQLRAEAPGPDPVAAWIAACDWRRWTWRLLPVAAALALAVAGVSRPESSATVVDAASDPVVTTEATGTPVTATLVTGAVTGDQLLQLLLSGTVDQTVVLSGGTQ